MKAPLRGFILNPHDPIDKQLRLSRGPDGTISAQSVTDPGLFYSLDFIRRYSNSRDAKETLLLLASSGMKEEHGS